MGSGLRLRTKVHASHIVEDGTGGQGGGLLPLKGQDHKLGEHIPAEKKGDDTIGGLLSGSVCLSHRLLILGCSKSLP